MKKFIASILIFLIISLTLRDLSIFSHEQKAAGPMFFVGSLTTRGTCNGCAENNYPWEGFHLLSSALASHPISRMGMRWSTDIVTQP